MLPTSVKKPKEPTTDAAPDLERNAIKRKWYRLDQMAAARLEALATTATRARMVATIVLSVVAGMTTAYSLGWVDIWHPHVQAPLPPPPPTPQAVLWTSGRIVREFHPTTEIVGQCAEPIAPAIPFPDVDRPETQAALRLFVDKLEQWLAGQSTTGGWTCAASSMFCSPLQIAVALDERNQTLTFVNSYPVITVAEATTYEVGEPYPFCKDKDAEHKRQRYDRIKVLHGMTEHVFEGDRAWCIQWIKELMDRGSEAMCGP